MAKRFRLRIWRVIPSFQSCLSKETSSLPIDPVPSFYRLFPVNATSNVTPPPPPPPPSKNHYSSLKRHVSSCVSSVGCRTRSKPTHSDEDFNEGPDEFHWEREDNWHVVAKVHHETPRRKIYNSSFSDDSLPLPPPPPPPPPSAEKKKRRAKKKIKKKTTRRLRISTSSAESGLFSSSDGFDDMDGEETETLVSSSRSFSTDSSSEFNGPHLETIREVASFDCPRRNTKKKKNKKKKKKKKKKEEEAKRCVIAKKIGLSPSPENESPARLSVFRKLMRCRLEGKVRESFAVVKRSEDPYEDFKRSMMEMILEKRMFNDQDLEQLLHCFLSLNSTHHHGIIVQAFSDIWETFFSSPPTAH